MTDLRTAAQQALEMLESLQGGCTDSDDGTVEAITVWCPEVIAALRAALEQSEQEPRREWQGLTEDEIYQMYNEPSSDAEMVEFARAIEAALKEKNYE